MKTIVQLFSALLALLVAVDPAASQPQRQRKVHVKVWDTKTKLADPIEIEKRDGWEVVEPGSPADHAFKGDAVLENEKLNVAFLSKTGDVIVYTKAPKIEDHRRASLKPVGSKGDAWATMTSVKISENSGSEATLDISGSAKNGETVDVSFHVVRERMFVEVKPVGNAKALRIHAPSRFIVMPDFFGDDMVFDPARRREERLFIPSENFVLGMLKGENGILMMVWPTGEQTAAAVLAGEPKDRCIDVTEITFDGKCIYVATLDAPGIWHEEKLNPAPADKDIAVRWERPFVAKWRADFCGPDRTDSWAFENGRKNTWIYLYGPMIWPSWFDGDRTFLHLTKRFVEAKGAIDSVLIYPPERHERSPLDLFTPVDILRETLGEGPCKYVLDREGLKSRSNMGERKAMRGGVCETTSIIEHIFLRDIEAREHELVEHLVDDILADNRTINARIQEYRKFGKDMLALCEQIAKESPELKPLTDSAVKRTNDIEGLYKAKLDTIKSPDHAAKLGARIKELAKRSDPENLGECKVLANELRGIAGTQHRLVGDYRVLVKRLKQEAAVAGSKQASAAKASEKIRDLGNTMLKNKFGVEAD